jgi:hypothetical protein
MAPMAGLRGGRRSEEFGFISVERNPAPQPATQYLPTFIFVEYFIK